MSDEASTEWTRRSILETTGVAGTAALVGTSPAVGREPGPKETEVLVGVSAGNDPAATVGPAVPSQATITHENRTLNYVAVAFPDAASQGKAQFIEAVQQRDAVKYAERNATHEAFFTPNDPRYSDQCVPQAVNADEAWDSTLGDHSTLIAVVDTGVQYDHPDLSGNVPSDPGHDMHDSDSDPYPDVPADEYHGTHVAGIANAVTDNSTGIAGLGDCSLKSCRALDESGAGSTADIADCIQWAANQGADVINLSLGGGGYTSTMKNAVTYAVNNGALPICAAGGSGSSGVSYPAAYSECVAVSAIDCDEDFASFSSYGSAIDVCAPGVDVLSTTTQTRGSYERLSGTSMATPVVSGVACLAESQWGNLTPNALRNHLTGTAVDVGLSSSKQGCGRVDAANAVQVDPATRSCNCGASCGGGGGNCGARSNTGSLSDSLSGYTDSDCWTWAWTYSSPCEVVVELSGPSNADFDLYVNEGTATCPTTSSYDYRAWTTNSQESITIANPDTSTDLYILVDSYSGSGSYTLDVTENAT